MVHFHRSAADVLATDWRKLEICGIDQSQEYLRFREKVEPGDPVLVIADNGEWPTAAFHGAITTPWTPLFSHPWKMLCDSQFLRLTDDASAHEQTARHQRLIAELQGRFRSEGPGWECLTACLGEVIVLRGFDTSKALLQAGLAEEAKLNAILTLLHTLQNLVVEGVAGAIALPFVHPCDTLLRRALAQCGFSAGVLTGASVFDLSAAQSYEEFLARLPKRRRRRYRKEQEAFESSGMTARTVVLGDYLERITELEAGNIERHGGTPNRSRLMNVRAEMYALLGDAVRVPVAELDGRIIACGIDLVDSDNYLGLVFGCDYTLPRREMVYSYLAFYDPIRFAIKHGIRWLRLGFEAFAPKLYRGARLEAREMWLWLPDEAIMRTLGNLLDYLSMRSHAFFTSLAASTQYVPAEVDHLSAPSLPEMCNPHCARGSTQQNSAELGRMALWGVRSLPGL